MKPPTLARHHSIHLHELFYRQEVLLRNMELISHHQLEKFGKGQKETHVLTKQEILLGKGTQVESSRVREPRRTALPHGSQSQVLW